MLPVAKSAPVVARVCGADGRAIPITFSLCCGRIRCEKATDLHAAGGEIDADGGTRVRRKHAGREAREQVGLADARVANQHQLEQEVVAAGITQNGQIRLVQSQLASVQPEGSPQAYSAIGAAAAASSQPSRRLT